MYVPGTILLWLDKAQAVVELLLFREQVGAKANINISKAYLLENLVS